VEISGPAKCRCFIAILLGNQQLGMSRSHLKPSCSFDLLLLLLIPKPAAAGLQNRERLQRAADSLSAAIILCRRRIKSKKNGGNDFDHDK
jgi:hypothetical protein